MIVQMQEELCRRSALTLIEVLVALVIIGGSVTAMLVAQSNSLGALKGSEMELTAQHLAKELIATWAVDKEDLQSDASGGIPAHRAWTWRRATKRIALIEGTNATEVTLHVAFDSGIPRAAPWRREFVWLIDKPTGQKEQ